MKTWKKLLSLFLAVLMLCGTLTGLVVTVSADETTATTDDGTADDATTEDTSGTLDYLNQVFATPQAKLDTMQLKLTKGNFELYCDEYSGEVAVKNTATGQILSTNPYDIGVGRASGAEVSTESKQELMSQIIITYEDNGKTKTYNSYTYATERDQITVKNIRNGIRVEYVIGREEARHLVPRMITDERFRTMLLGPMLENLGVRSYLEELGLVQPGQDLSELDISTIPEDIFNTDNKAIPFRLRQLIAWYGGQNGMKCLENQATDSLKQALIANYPVLKKQPDMKFWTFDSSVSSAQLEKQEEFIKTYAPDYSYEEMDYDHQLTEYESDETNPPVFKMALEYTLDVGDDGTIDGLTVRLPVNGLSYNESLYQLTDINILPYMGCGNNTYDGYVFFPDGSGTLFAMEDLRDSTRSASVARDVYGEDYAYHKINDTYQQTVRYPAFGIVEDTVYYKCYQYNETTGQTEYTLVSGVLYDKIKNAEEKGTTLDDTKMPGIKDVQSTISNATSIEKTVIKRGFAAIIEEGDALTSMKYYHAGSLANYDTVQLNFNPRPQDSYNLADSISVGTNTEWTVVTDRKYTGNFKLHYVMLSDETAESEAQEDSIALATGVNSDGSYAASWMGMAYAYRDYLLAKDMLSQLSAEETSGDIPLYIETFGTQYTTEKIASIPVSVKKALTSAADVITMYEELQEAGIKNVNFKLTGYANGGMYAKMPYNLKWEKAVSKGEDENGDKVTMSDLFDYAADSDGLELFPDFDFSYVSVTGWFDGLSMRKHVVRTIDDRYASKKEYEPTTQKFVSYYQLAISPAYFSHFYEKFLDKYLEYNVSGISVASLGNALNSDFDEDEPYNREDSRTFVKKALEYISSQNLDIMVEGGNVYTWKYVKHILDAPLDSSRFIKSSYSVPFLGVVLHGYVNYAGSPLNMEGDVNYAKLKAIESGASPYFILAYDNTEILKEYYSWSHYYSVRYDIWKDDVIALYNELNEALKDVQNKSIVKHEFLSGLRVPDLDELEEDMDSLYDAVLDYQQNQAEYELAQRNQAISEARNSVSKAEEKAVEFVKTCLNYYSGSNSGAAFYYAYGNDSLETRLRNFVEADASLKQVQAEYEAAMENGTEDEQEALAAAVKSAETTRRGYLNKVTQFVNNAVVKIKKLEDERKIMQQLYEDAQSGALLINDPATGVHASIVNDINDRLEAIDSQINDALGLEFKYTVDKAEMDTFFNVHIGLLVASANGDTYGKQAAVLGKAENLYDLLQSGEFGLMKGNDAEYALLRYLEENKTLTDAQLDAKYGLTDLKEGETSTIGLIKYARELFGTKYEFDPLLSDEKGEDGYSDVDKHILSYFIYKLYNHVSSDLTNDLLPELNFKTGTVEITDDEGNVTSYKLTGTNNKAVISTIQSAAKKEFEAHIKAVTDGDYKKGVAELVETQVKAALKTIADKAPGVGEKPVEYATPDTLEADLRAHLTAYYYTLAIPQVQTADTIENLSIVTVTYTTETSISTLVADRYAAMQKAGVDVKKDYAAMVEAIQADTVAQEKLELILEGMEWLDMTDTETVEAVRANLMTAYLQAMAVKLNVKTMPSGAKFTFAADTNNKNTELSNDLIARIQQDGVVNADLTSYVNEIKALLATEDYALKTPAADDAELEALVKQFVSAAYLVAASQQTAQSYYLDAQMGAMDKAVREAVTAKHDAILAALPEQATVYDVYDAILAALGNTEDSVAQLTKEIAAGITYTVDTSKYSVSSDVQSYYIYLLFQSFSEQLTDDTEPVLTIYKEDGTALKKTDQTYKNAIKAISKKYVETPISELISEAKLNTKRGEIVDYSLSRLLSDAEMDAWVEDVYAQLKTSKYLEGSANEKGAEQLKSDIESYLRYQYYQTLMKDKMKAGKTQTKFNVSEVYGDDLLTASNGIKSMIYYFVPALCEEITSDTIDEMVRESVILDEDESDEDSKYLTNDGRIVAVTYGSKSGSSYTNDKTFLLNYNNFSVSVRYDDVTYTIPAYGYVVVTH